MAARILAYDDNPAFGGHQVMACRGIEALAADPGIEILFMHNPANRRLAGALANLPGVRLLASPCESRRLQGLRNRMDRRAVRELAARFRHLAPDLVLCIQGDIEQSSQAVLAARLAGIECASYLALPHTFASMGARLGALRDRANRYLLDLPDRYIAISAGMERLLRERGVSKPVAVVPNGIPLPAPRPAPAAPPRAPQTTLGLIGRIEFNQKGQDFMVRTFLRHPEAFAGTRLLIAGDGPDADTLRRLAAGRPAIELLPWQHDPEAFYGAIDVLALPSRYEGLPLVMLEALARGIPVIGSARDGMKETLPAAWTFEPGDARDLARAFAEVRRHWREGIEPLRRKIAGEHRLDRFQANFRRAVAAPQAHAAPPPNPI